MKLLIVDDELWSRKLINNLLPWVDYGFNEIYLAEDGEQALEILQKYECDLMITDMRMPGVDGAMLLEEIIRNNIDVEVIVMSGYEDYKYLHSALKIKAIDYLLKPVEKDKLHLAVMTGVGRILKKNSFSYVEEILFKDDLKFEVNKYHELKNNLIKAVLASNDKNILSTIEVLRNTFFNEKSNPNFTNYIVMDLKRHIGDIEKEYDIHLIVESVSTLDNLCHRMLHVSEKIKEKRSTGKTSILEVQRYIEQHLDENLSLADISNKFFVSKEHLSRMFKKEIGVSVQQYITNKKIEFAKKLLRNHTMIGISTIALMVGYNDLQYFYRVFKKIEGVTPLQYRTQYQNNAKDASI